MAYGDAILASGVARGFHAQGKLAAFSEMKRIDGEWVPAGKRIFWTEYCDDIFAHNPNIARPGQEGQDNLIWFPHYKKVFSFCHLDKESRRFIWTPNFTPKPGEFFFTAEELICPIDGPFIVIEPNLAWQRQITCNKDWGNGKFEALAKALINRGHKLVQFVHKNSRRLIDGAHRVRTASFHQAAAIMSKARLVIAPEGANHHAAAAVNVPAVIIWGDWSPHWMGYENQIKLSGSASLQACGSAFHCSHCRQVMDSISVDEAYEAAIGILQ